jgi:hypothetical protein
VLKERIDVRRVGITERQLFQDTFRRERLVVEDLQHTGLVREQYPTDPAPDGKNGMTDENPDAAARPDPESGFLENLVRKALE